MKLKWRRIAAVAVGATALAASTACGGGGDVSAGPTPQVAATVDPRADWPKKFVLGYFGGDDAEALLQRQTPFKAYLEERLGIPVELFTGTSYNAVIEAMRADRVDGMAVGPFSYVLAVQEAQAEAVGVLISCPASQRDCVVDPKAAPFYQSVVFTKKGSGVNRLEDFRDKGFNFVDPASTSGHLAPKTLLIKRGFNPDKEFKTVFAGSHPTAVLSVWNDKAPGGATNEGNLLSLATSKQAEVCLWSDGEISRPRTEDEIRRTFDACPSGKLAIMAITDPIPNTPMAVRSDLPDTFKKAVAGALLDIQKDPQLVAQLRYWYVNPSEQLGLRTLDSFYNSLRDIAKLLNLDLKELA